MRPPKQGLEYFSCDVDMDEDDKTTDLLYEFGNRGLGLLIRLLGDIYRLGYCIRWNSDDKRRFAQRTQEVAADVEKFTHCLIESGFFSRKIYEKYGILTSRGIQARWMMSTIRRGKVLMKEELLLLDQVQVHVEIVPTSAQPVGPNNSAEQSFCTTETPAEMSYCSTETPLNSGSCTTETHKVKKSKVKKSKEDQETCAREASNFSENEEVESEALKGPKTREVFRDTQTPDSQKGDGNGISKATPEPLTKYGELRLSMLPSQWKKVIARYGHALVRQELPFADEWIDLADTPRARKYRRPGYNHYLFFHTTWLKDKRLDRNRVHERPQPKPSKQLPQKPNIQRTPEQRERDRQLMASKGFRPMSDESPEQVRSLVSTAIKTLEENDAE